MKKNKKQKGFCAIRCKTDVFNSSISARIGHAKAEIAPGAYRLWPQRLLQFIATIHVTVGKDNNCQTEQKIRYNETESLFCTDLNVAAARTHTHCTKEMYEYVYAAVMHAISQIDRQTTPKESRENGK